MKELLRVARCAAVALCAGGCTVEAAPYLAFRSQSLNGARDLVGLQPFLYQHDVCGLNGIFSLTPEYTRSFRDGDIARCLLCNSLTRGTCGGAQLRIQGSDIAGRAQNSLMAENFYLPSDYDSTVSLEPRVENFLVDFNFYLGFDRCHPGLYFRIHAPLVYSRRSLNVKETITKEGEGTYPLGYFDGSLTDGVQPLSSFEEFIIDGASPVFADNVTCTPLQNARWNKCRATKTGVADVRMALGWNFVLCEDYHVGLQICAAAPTGTKPCGAYFFEPIIGNGKHWELGGGLSAHACLCRSQDEDRHCDLYLDANITHLFKSHQYRTFDLINSPLSRYALAMKFTSDVEGLVALGQEAAPVISTPSYQFARVFAPVANFSTLPVDVSAAVQADVVLKLAWVRNNYEFDLGYNLWARSCEKICRNYDRPCSAAVKFPANTWGLKGDAFCFGFTQQEVNGQETLIEPGTPLSATESKATIFKGTNGAPTGLTVDENFLNWYQNPGIDNPELAAKTGPTDLLYTAINNSVKTSNDPILINDSILDFKGAQTKGISHKVFFHFSHFWKDGRTWAPFIGVGAEAEFGQHDGKDRGDMCSSKCISTSMATKVNQNAPSCVKSCDTMCSKSKNTSCCTRCALSQWGVWLKGGVAFS